MLLLATATAHGQVGDAARLSEAKRLFRQGNELRKAGDFQRALELYQQSRAIVASVPNTLDAAVCLQQLGRDDEALELYEILLTELADKLGPDDKQAIAAATRQLRPRVASVEVSANVAGTLVVDGRMRSSVPMRSPVRVMPGTHVIRVLKDGFETFEKRVTLRAGATTRIDARLSPLGVAGKLRVDSAAARGADLYVDGALLGRLPWEGTLAPGQHVVFVRKGDTGTAPSLLKIVEGQTALVEPRPRPLSRELRVLVEPPTAPLTIDGVPLGNGSWRGRLPVGKHVLEAREEGYRPGHLAQTVGATSSGDILLRLAIDPDHPRWATAHGRIFVEAFGGYAFGGSLGSDAESPCDAGHCSSEGSTGGILAGARGGYELPFHLALEVTGGYLSIGKTLTRSLDHPFTDNGTPVPVTYTYNDDIRLSGPFAALGLAYRADIGEHFGVDVRADFGAVLMRSTDQVTASAATADESAAAFVQNAGAAAGSAALFAMPAAEVRVRLGAFHVGAGLVVPVFLLRGPQNDHGDTGVVAQGRCDATANRDSVDCAPFHRAVAAERTYGRFVLLVPVLAAGYTF